MPRQTVRMQKLKRAVKKYAQKSKLQKLEDQLVLAKRLLQIAEAAHAQVRQPEHGPPVIGRGIHEMQQVTRSKVAVQNLEQLVAEEKERLARSKKSR